MRFFIPLVALFLAPVLAAQPVTGLSGWSIVIDPGHSFDENQGAFGYSEANKVLAVGLELQRLLVETTDIDTVYMTRTNSTTSVSLTQRTTYANQVGAAYFHSIHSDAGPPEANSTLIMYGGWRENGQTVEKTPHGGRLMGEYMDHYLTAAMRTGRRGNYADRTFYQGFPFEHANKFPYLHVNRVSAMASTLSEAGFHTNPAQNQRNMNADWKRMEARSLYWSILEYNGAARPDSRIVMGIVQNVEDGQPINGAEVTIAGKTYTTDTYASLFNRFTNDPDRLANGFYYIEDLAAGTYQVTINAAGYAPFTTTVTPIDTFFTFLDPGLVSTTPPTVAVALPENEQDNFRIIDPIVLTFSRPMDRQSVESGFTITPEVTGRFAWSNGDRRMTFVPDSLIPFTNYTVTIAASAQSPFGYTLDGDGDGTAGEGYTLTFRTGAADVLAPRVVDAYPLPNGQNILRDLVVSVTYDELVDTASIDPAGITLTLLSGGEALEGTLQVAETSGQTVISFAPSTRLQANTFYRFQIAPGVRDIAGNAVTGTQSIVFKTGAEVEVYTNIENFEGSFTNNWWAPIQSGSTTTNNVVADSTTFRAESHVVNPQGGAQSMALNYGWFPQERAPFLIREYLGGGAPRNVFFDATSKVQAYVFGDGSGTLFRFALDDEGPGGHEVSPWRKVDWKGWRMVEWNLATEAPGTWIGDGKLDGNLRFDSFQLSYDNGAAFGTLYFDDLRVAKTTTTAIDDSELPSLLVLGENVPNPFTDRTMLVFSLPTPAAVTLRVFDTLGREVAVLADELSMQAGTHSLSWDAGSLSSGVYLVRIEAAGQVQARPITLVR